MSRKSREIFPLFCKKIPIFEKCFDEKKNSTGARFEGLVIRQCAGGWKIQKATLTAAFQDETYADAAGITDGGAFYFHGDEHGVRLCFHRYSKQW
jgi:hypothetical protein